MLPEISFEVPGVLFFKKIDFLLSFLLTFLLIYRTLLAIRRWVEQLAARRAHNPEAAGSSPAPAITDHSEMSGFLFLTEANWTSIDN